MIKGFVFSFAILTFILLLAACSDGREKTTAVVQNTDPVKQVAVIAVPRPAGKPGKVLFDNKKPFEIISSAREITTASSAPDTNQCKGWTLARKDLATIIKGCRSISGQEWHYLFDVLPCVVEGELKQNGQVYPFEINGGSWMSVRCPDTTIRLGNYKQQHEKYFLSKAWDPDKEPG